MTQDPYGQPPGSGYVVHGEVVPDDEANVTPSAAPMTHFQKVASALRGGRTDPAVADGASSDQEAGPAGTPSPDPGGTWPGADPAGTAGPDARDEADDEADRDATRPEEVIAVPAGEDAAQDPTMTQPDLYGSAARLETGTATAGTADAAGITGAAGQVVGKHAGAPAQEGLRPGEHDSRLGDFSDLTYGSLLPDAAEFKARWQQVQFRFVDDPPGSVTEAADVISQVTAKLEAAIAERQRAIADRQRALRDRWSEGQSTDTESLRETLLMYRAFLDQLTGPKAG